MIIEFSETSYLFNWVVFISSRYEKTRENNLKKQDLKLILFENIFKGQISFKIFLKNDYLIL